MQLELYSEPFARTGNIAAEGSRNLLGRPPLGLLQTLLREAIQNSVDAGVSGIKTSIRLRYRTLTGAQAVILRKQVLFHIPEGDHTRAAMEASLQKESIKVLEIADFGTSGLGGPTRADIAPAQGEAPDFVNFLRNVGIARDTHLGGGTYGYGKTSLYAMSACSTIIVDSLATVENRRTRRFMGCHLGSAYEAASNGGPMKRFTGRHWWGARDGEGSIEPAVDHAATELACSLGMPERSTEDTGTTIMIIDPYQDNGDTGSLADDMVESVLWNFWPRMAASTPPERKLEIRIEFEGKEIAIPVPEEFPPLDLFCSAMDEYRKISSRNIHCRSPTKELGTLKIRRGFCSARSRLAARECSIIPSQASHIALMRPVELVVKYLEGTPFPDRRFEWAGIFVCSDDPEVEGAFAKSEPPTHDDWIPDILPTRREKTFVNTALRNIRQAAEAYAAPSIQPGKNPADGPSLARTAALMGRLLEGITHEKPQHGSGKSSIRKGTHVTPISFRSLELGEEGAPVAVFETVLHNDGSDPTLVVTAEPFLVADGGAIRDEDLPDDFMPEVLEISLPEAGISGDNNSLRVGKAAGTIEVRVRGPKEAAVGLKISLESSGQ